MAQALVGADGYRSIVRRTVNPEQPDADYAGYLLWIGIANEADLGALRLNCITRRQVTGTPVAEYVPSRLTAGRLTLVGDAAHVPTPMTGTGFSELVIDAEALAAALRSVTSDQVAAALERYEQDRLPRARALVQSGQQFSRSFAAGRH